MAKTKNELPPDEQGFLLDDVEQKHIVAVLAHAEGNKTRAARMLGIDRKTLYRKMRRMAKANIVADGAIV